MPLARFGKQSKRTRLGTETQACDETGRGEGGQKKKEVLMAGDAGGTVEQPAAGEGHEDARGVANDRDQADGGSRSFDGERSKRGSHEQSCW